MSPITEQVLKRFQTMIFHEPKNAILSLFWQENISLEQKKAIAFEKHISFSPQVQTHRERHKECIVRVWIQPGGRADCVWREVREHWGTFPAPCHPARHCCSICSRYQEVGPQPPCWTPCCSNTKTDIRYATAALNFRSQCWKWPENNMYVCLSAFILRFIVLVLFIRWEGDRVGSEAANQAEREMWFSFESALHNNDVTSLWKETQLHMKKQIFGCQKNSLIATQNSFGEISLLRQLAVAVL